MMDPKKKLHIGLTISIIALVLIIDQWIKFYIKTHFMLHESYEVTSWFYLLFTENDGMAFGWNLFNKLFLTSFRIIAVAFIAYYVIKLICRKVQVQTGYIVCLALVTAGAAGNIFDCIFYGLIFNESTPWSVASLVPFGEGYSGLFTGKVVDMLYFPLFSWTWPEGIPVFGGMHCVFFSPIFNFADASISCGIIAILLFYRKYLTTSKDE